MRTLSSVCLISAVTLAQLGEAALTPAVAQEGATISQSRLRSQGQQEQPPMQAGDVPKLVMQGQELESVLGKEIRTREEEVGRIIDLLADRNGQVLAGVVELGGFLGIGTRKIAVEWSAFRFDTTSKRSPVLLEMSREQLRLAPEYKPSEPAPVIVRKAEE